MMELVHMTATYSNAMLVAILPHVSDFEKKLDLPIEQPITTQAVYRFNPCPYKGRVEGAFWLTNGYWFHFDYRGYVDSFRSPDNWFFEQEPLENYTNYLGQTRMTTNEIVTFARETLQKLGYPPEATHADTTPQLEGPWNLKRGGHIPQCRVIWEPIKDQDDSGYSKVAVEINAEKKTVVGLSLIFSRTNNIGTPLKVDVEPELETDFRKRTKVGGMFIRSNAPPTLPKK